MSNSASAVCTDVQGHLSAYIDARLSTAELARIRGHLNDCSACQDERAALEQTDALVEAALADHPFDDAFVEELVTTLPVQLLKARPVPAHRKLRPAGTGLAALAAGLLIALGIGLTTDRADPEAPVALAPTPDVATAGEGLLLLESDGTTVALAPGQAIRSGDHVLAITTPASVSLADGTRIDLHADTEVALARDADGGLTVAMHGTQGKLFCDVAKREHPFRVHARDLDVLVLGTQFLVHQRYASSGVIVVEGKVLAKTTRDRRTLKYGDQAEAYLNAGQGRLSLSRVTPRRHGMWVPQIAEMAPEPAPTNQPAPVEEEPSAPTSPTGPADPAGLDLPVDVPTLDENRK